MNTRQEWKTVGLEILETHRMDCGDGSCGCGCGPFVRGPAALARRRPLEGDIPAEPQADSARRSGPSPGRGSGTAVPDLRSRSGAARGARRGTGSPPRGGRLEPERGRRLALGADENEKRLTGLTVAGRAGAQAMTKSSRRWASWSAASTASGVSARAKRKPR